MLHHMLRAAAGSAWTPANLFANGEQGVWYEPKPQYLFQDAAGTVPVEVDGDPVGYMQDLSGNGHHATQSASSARPTYRTNGVLNWLEFDGEDDWLNIGSIVPDSQSHTHFYTYKAHPSADAPLYLTDFSDGRLIAAHKTSGSESSGFFDGAWKPIFTAVESKQVASYVFNAATSSATLTRNNNTPGSVSYTPKFLGGAGAIGASFDGAARHLPHDLFGVAIVAGAMEDTVSPVGYFANLAGIQL